MVTVPVESVIAWVVLGGIAGFVIGVRVATYFHFKALKGTLCEKCQKGFWDRYNDAWDR